MAGIQFFCIFFLYRHTILMFYVDYLAIEVITTDASTSFHLPLFVDGYNLFKIVAPQTNLLPIPIATKKKNLKKGNNEGPRQDCI